MNRMVSEYLRTATFPVAVKVYRKGESVPPECRAKAPLKDFGHRLAVCQAVTMARKLGSVIQLSKKDQACPLAQVILGYAEEPDFIKDGSVVYPLYVSNMEAAKRTQETTPKMPKADTGAILVAPLHRAAFEPDVIILYGNAAQIVRMVQGALYHEGGYIESRFSGRGACGGEITVPLTQQKCNVIAPGGGERVFALTSDEELAFAVPSSQFQSFIEGVIETHKGGVARIPTPIAGVNLEPRWPSTYEKLAAYMESQ
jgi:uncharacterized protein (DUF169 family)